MSTTVKPATKWSEPVMRIYQKYPAAYKSKNWDEIVRLANTDQMAEALMLASDHEDRHKSHRAHNVIARRIRLQRTQLYKIKKEHETRIKDVFQVAGMRLANRMIHLPNNLSSIAPMREKTREVIVDLRKNLNVIITDLIWQSIILGVKNMGEAIKPILRDNAESFHVELNEIALIEERLTLGISKRLANKTNGTVNTSSDKWQQIMDRIYANIAKSNLTGSTLSERIWDLTNRAEQDIRRTLASDIAMGKPSREIADKIQRYVFTSGVDDVQQGPGVYRSPLKNAMRLARTETNRAYTQASAAWAENKPWVKAIRVTLSPAHKEEDDCDDIAGEEYSPEEFVGVVPVHPNCMCYGTFVVDENYLTGDTPAKEDEE